MTADSRPAQSSARAIRVAPARTEGEWAHARRLTMELISWLGSEVDIDARAQQHDTEEELDGMPTYYEFPVGVFLVGYIDGVPSGTTGVHLMTPDTAELRRVWVTPDARGNRLAPAFLPRRAPCSGVARRESSLS